MCNVLSSNHTSSSSHRSTLSTGKPFSSNLLPTTIFISNRKYYSFILPSPPVRLWFSHSIVAFPYFFIKYIWLYPPPSHCPFHSNPLLMATPQSIISSLHVHPYRWKFNSNTFLLRRLYFPFPTVFFVSYSQKLKQRILLLELRGAGAEVCYCASLCLYNITNIMWMGHSFEFL